MFELTELLVNKDDNLTDLIETRARSFYANTGIEPTIVFASMSVVRQLFFITTGQLPSGNVHGRNQLVYYSSLGQMEIHPIKELKDFLMVGESHSYGEYYNNEDVPEILWGECARQKIDSKFEELVLNS